MPIKVTPVAPSGPSPIAAGSDRGNDIRQPERLNKLDEQIESVLVASLPQGRCGFATCAQDDPVTSRQNLTEEQADTLRRDEEFRNRVLAAESLEECLKIIEAQVSGSLTGTPEMHQSAPAKPVAPIKISIEENKECSSDFTLWGNRIPG
jgi:hypothetical protein